MSLGSKLLSVFVGLLLGNLFAQSFHVIPDIGLALERTYFQGMALLTFWFCDTVLWKTTVDTTQG